MDLSKEKLENIRPLRDLVAVSVLPPKDIITDSGIIGVETSKSTWQGDSLYEGRVVALSNEAKEKAPWLTLTDVVLFHRLHEDYIPTTGDSYVKLVPWSMILGRKLNSEEPFDVEQFEPFYERVIVKVEEETNITESGIEIVGDKESIYDKGTGSGTMVGVSPDLVKSLDELKIGDRIRWNKFAGTKIEMAVKQGTQIVYRDYVLVNYHEIIAVVNKD